MSHQPLIMLGLPKGSLEESTNKLFAKAGWKIKQSSRSYRPVIDDPEIGARMIRAQEMSRYVEDGFFDVGLTGLDWIIENNSDVVSVCDLIYSRASNTPARWVLAVPAQSSINRPEDLEGKKIATELVNTTHKYLAEKNVQARVEFSWGATEVKVPELVDAIVELTETGNSLRANNLRIIDTIVETSPRLIANRRSWENKEKRSKIEAISILLQGALESEKKVGVKLNCPKEKLDDLLQVLPALYKPTIAQLSDPEWIALEVVIDEEIVREIIPDLKKSGAQGITEYPLNKIIP